MCDFYITPEMSLEKKATNKNVLKALHQTIPDDVKSLFKVQLRVTHSNPTYPETSLSNWHWVASEIPKPNNLLQFVMNK